MLVASYDTGSVGRVLEDADQDAERGVVTHLDLGSLTSVVLEFLTDRDLASSARN